MAHFRAAPTVQRVESSLQQSSPIEQAIRSSEKLKYSSLTDLRARSLEKFVQDRSGEFDEKRIQIDIYIFEINQIQTFKVKFKFKIRRLQVQIFKLRFSNSNSNNQIQSEIRIFKFKFEYPDLV